MRHTELTPEILDLIRHTVEATLCATPPTAWEILKSDVARELREMLADKAIAEAMPDAFAGRIVHQVAGELRRAVRMAVDQEMLTIRMHLYRISAVLLPDVPSDC